MVFSRRNFFKQALAMPIAASLGGYEALAAAEKGQVRITDIKAIALKEKRGSSRGLVKIETDAGLVGYGPSEGGPETRVAIAMIENGPDGLIGKDPLSIHVHFHNMFYSHAQRPRNVNAYSGVDMALWDLAGKILNQPVSKLLGGNFRDEIDTYSHLLPPNRKLTALEAQNDYLNKDAWQARAQMLKSYKGGFKAFKIDIHPSLGARNGEFTPNLGPREVDKVRRVYELAREALGFDYDIDVHCHNELDLPSAIKVARAVEDIKPLFFEDPLFPEFSESWAALRRSTSVPIITGESLSLIEGTLPFMQNQSVDILQPDLVHAGGITGTKIIADVAASYRMPIALHNVAGYALNLASQQFAASVFNCPRIECRPWFDEAPEAAGNIPVVKDGRMQVASLPGLGILLNEDYLKGNLADGEPWWG
ncbi:MAG: mandelate racemase/muconate lactonizing enzyme family protein [Candidatus Acidiferrales bacterium]|jgi:galactonate dehydratase